jgi:alpha/beta superfamily hydrolase
VLAGYSFGAAMAAGIIGDVAPGGVLLVSPPVHAARTAADSGVRALLATGRQDTLSPYDQLQALAREGVDVLVVPGVDHTWSPGIDRLTESVLSFARGLTAA